MATTFQDASSQQWTINLTLLEAERLNKAGVDIATALDGPQFFRRLVIDAAFLLDALTVLCAEEASQRGFSPDQLAKLFHGDSIASAAEAIAKEVIGFFPLMAKQIAQKFWELDQAHLEAVASTVSEATVTDLETLDDNATDLQESSEGSTQEDTDSGS